MHKSSRVRTVGSAYWYSIVPTNTTNNIRSCGNITLSRPVSGNLKKCKENRHSARARVCSLSQISRLELTLPYHFGRIANVLIAKNVLV